MLIRVTMRADPGPGGGWPISATNCSKVSTFTLPPMICVASWRIEASALSLASRSAGVSHNERTAKTPPARSALAVTPR
jgi:hypothetical protein